MGGRGLGDWKAKSRRRSACCLMRAGTVPNNIPSLMGRARREALWAKEPGMEDWERRASLRARTKLV